MFLDAILKKYRNSAVLYILFDARTKVNVCISGSYQQPRHNQNAYPPNSMGGRVGPNMGQQASLGQQYLQQAIGNGYHNQQQPPTQPHGKPHAQQHGQKQQPTSQQQFANQQKPTGQQQRYQEQYSNIRGQPTQNGPGNPETIFQNGKHHHYSGYTAQ
jgi:hypothetical protein